METFPHSEWKEKKENLAIKKSQSEEWVECDDDDEDTAEYNRERKAIGDFVKSKSRVLSSRVMSTTNGGEI